MDPCKHKLTFERVLYILNICKLDHMSSFTHGELLDRGHDLDNLVVITRKSGDLVLYLCSRGREGEGLKSDGFYARQSQLHTCLMNTLTPQMANASSI